MEALTIIIIILIVAGAAPLVVCIIKMKMLNAFKKNSLITNAIVANVDERYHYKVGKVYRVTVEYKTSKEVLYIAIFSSFKKQVSGDTVPLMYKPDDPTKFSVDFGKKTPYAIAITLVFFLLIVWFCVWISNLEYSVQ